MLGYSPIDCMTDPLEKLFGSPARVRLMRLFLFNPREQFSAGDASQRSRTTLPSTRRELNLLHSIGLLRRARKNAPRFGLNADFTHLAALQNLLLNAPARSADIHEQLRGAGVVKLVIVAGIFVGDWDGRIDILVVGDRLSDKKLRTSMRRLESEIGKELRFATLATPDFLYRLNMNDKLIRDVFDYPHKIVFDRLDIGLK